MEICATMHKTVRRVIERAEAGVTARPAPVVRPRNYDGLTDLVAQRVRKSKGGTSAKRLLPIAVAAGYEGSPRNFRLVAGQKGVVPAVHSPIATLRHA